MYVVRNTPTPPIAENKNPSTIAALSRNVLCRVHFVVVGVVVVAQENGLLIGLFDVDNESIKKPFGRKVEYLRVALHADSENHPSLRGATAVKFNFRRLNASRMGLADPSK